MGYLATIITNVIATTGKRVFAVLPDEHTPARFGARRHARD
jgi:hypothetical protein